MSNFFDFFNEIKKALNNADFTEHPQYRRFETPWGGGYYYSTVSYSTPNSWDSSQNGTAKVSVADRIKNLENELNIAILKENYLTAAEIRDKLKDLKENYNEYEVELKKLQTEKDLAIEAENYEKAEDLKNKIADLTTKLKLE